MKPKPVAADSSVGCSVQLKGPSVMRTKFANGTSRGPIRGAIMMDRTALDLGLTIHNGALEVSLRPQDTVNKLWGYGITSSGTSNLAGPDADVLFRIEPKKDDSPKQTTVRMVEPYAKNNTCRFLEITSDVTYVVIDPGTGRVLREIIRTKTRNIYTHTVQDPKKFKALIRRVNKRMGLRIPLTLDPLSGTWSSV